MLEYADSFPGGGHGASQHALLESGSESSHQVRSVVIENLEFREETQSLAWLAHHTQIDLLWLYGRVGGKEHTAVILVFALVTPQGHSILRLKYSHI